MTINEKLKLINEAVDNWMTEKQRVDKTAEMLRDMEDGESIQLEIVCKGTHFFCNRVEGVALYSLVYNIVKIGLENRKADYEKCKKELERAWNETRGNK